MNFACNLPLNKLSFGQTALNILFEFYKKELNPLIFPIGQPDFSTHSHLDGFSDWINKNIKNSLKTHKRTHPTFKLWHVREDSLSSLSQKQVLLTFHECDQLTPIEANIIKNNNAVIVTSDYSKDVFNEFGCNNVVKAPLGFDSNSFKVLTKKFHPDNVIQFGLVGKLEHRKKHIEIMKAWVKKYGNNREYVLNCAVFNPHIQPQDQERIIVQALEGKKYWNVTFNPFMDKNSAYNDYLNSNDIVIGVSAAEGWGLPEFQSVALGKHSIILNATGYKEWATNDNSTLITPNGKVSLVDNMFFRQGDDYNQGSGYSFAEDDLLNAFDTAVSKVKCNKINTEGLKLQENFSWLTTADIILNTLESI